MKQTSAKAKKNSGTILPLIVLLAPAATLFSLFVVFPVVQAAYYSLYRWKGIGPITDFYGLKNFIAMFKDPIFITAFWNNIKIIVFSLLLQLPTAFLFALFIGRRPFLGSVLLRGLYFFPYVLAEIGIGIIWRFIYHPEFGIPTKIAQLINSAAGQVSLLGSTETAFGAIFIVIFWKYIGFHMILYVAGLQNVPSDLEEAAIIDGANKLQVVTNVIIPCLKSTLIISIFMSITGSFNVFDVVWAMGQGGPLHSTETLVVYLYNFGFRRNAFGYGSAVAIVVFLMCLVFNIIYQKYLVGEEK
jgi:raffinose/stachyose/melibiose transport system permease protein